MSVVMKFGGTSVADAAAFENVARIVANERDAPPVVVVSAMSGITDSLLAATNIASLENVFERAVGTSDSTVLDERLLPEKVISQANSVQNAPAPPAVPQLELQDGLLPPDLSFETAIQNFKRQLVRQALRECNGLRTEAAHRLKISRQYLHRLINELNVEG